MEGEMNHFSHEHPLILKAEEQAEECKSDDDGTNHSDTEIKTCDGCSKPISGPFYRCNECDYFLHKVRAELPKEMNYPMHPQHPLILLSKPSSGYADCICDVCHKRCDRFVYHCSICDFDVDMMCASASQKIEDKCHPKHSLIPLQHPISLPCCHICQTQKKGLSYKCTTCPFWVHQNCTISLPSTLKCSYHDHQLTFLPSVPSEYNQVSDICDVCHGNLSIFQCVYYCAGCMFFAHVGCARFEAPQTEAHASSSRSRDLNTEIGEDFLGDGQCPILLPVQQKTTDLISWFVENHIDRVTTSDFMIDHFCHEHPLFMLPITEGVCDACGHAISSSTSYGCVLCRYFLHKCCTELPVQILHPSHPEHQITLWPYNGLFQCHCCYQSCNGFAYKCFECENFHIDIKCASLLRPVKHEAHRHPLIPKSVSASARCNECNLKTKLSSILQCDTCRFNLCFRCAMLPPFLEHRFDKHPYLLTYSPPENHYNEYYCDLCEKVLNPKTWFYYCRLCDQFAHPHCMVSHSADSNIKYGKSCLYKEHEHELTLINCTRNNSYCNYCHSPLKTDSGVGLECQPCDFKVHAKCLYHRRMK